MDAAEKSGLATAVRTTVFQAGTLGILVSWALLSLGAPFWYDALKDLLKLRPALAKKEEAQREDRRTEVAGAEGK